MDIKPGDFAAFPIQSSDAQGSLVAEQGITKREYFAAMALQGFAAHEKEGGWIATSAARQAVEYADALLAALRQGEGE